VSVEERLKDVFKCLYVIERDTGDIYLKMSKSLEDPLLSLTFKWISNESLNHAELLQTVLKRYFNVDVLSEDLSLCYRDLGELGEVVKQIYERLLPKEKLTARDVFDVLSFLDLIELNTGEELYSKLVIPLAKTVMLKHVKVEGDIEAKILSELFNSIAKEEENHEKLVKLIKTYLTT